MWSVRGRVARSEKDYDEEAGADDEDITFELDVRVSFERAEYNNKIIIKFTIHPTIVY